MGMLATAMKKNAVILQKPSATIAVRVDLNAIQRKAYDAFLYVVKENLRKDDKKRKFTILLDDLKEIFGETTSRDNAYYKKNVRELMTKVAEYNVLKKDKKVEGAFVLMSRVEFVEDINTKEIVCNFEVPEFVIDLIKDPKSPYANINLVVLKGLKSKYAVLLYELIKDYKNKEIPEMTMEEFRGLFGIENKYKAIKDLRKYVLEPAVRELNKNEKFDFLVSYELRRIGKRYRKIKFIVNPKPQKLKIEQQVEDYKTLAEDPDLRELLFLLPESYRKRKNCISLLSGALEKKNKEYVQAQIKYVNEKNPKNYCGYLKQAIEKDYAGAEIIEDFEIEEQDWKKKVIGKVVINKKTGERWKIVKVDEPDEDGHCAVRLDKVDSGEIKWIKWTEEKIKKLAGVQDESS